MCQNEAISYHSLVYISNKGYETQLFKLEFASSKCFWPKLKEGKSKK